MVCLGGVRQSISTSDISLLTLEVIKDTDLSLLLKVKLAALHRACRDYCGVWLGHSYGGSYTVDTTNDHAKHNADGYGIDNEDR